MSTNLAVSENNGLHEFRVNPDPVKNPALRIAAKIISYLFHPLFIPVYVVAFLVYVQPYLFAGFDTWAKKVIIIQAIVWYTLFPIVTVLLLKGLGFIDSVFLKTKKDRIIPYIACMTWYWWGWHVRQNLPDSPHELVIFTMAVFLASAAGFFANIYFKISMHTIAAGVMLAFVMLMAFRQSDNSGIYLAVALLLTGIIATARFIDSDHTPLEIYSGVVIGILSLVVATYFA